MAKKTAAVKPAEVKQVANPAKETKVTETTTATESARGVIPATAVYNLSQEQIDAAIEAGEIRQGTEPVDVTIKADSSPTKKDEKQPYEQLLALTWEGMVLLSGGKAEPQADRGDSKVDTRTETEKAKGAPDHFNYGLDLEVKRNLRRQLETEISGPAKVIERTAKLLFDQKMFPSLDAAREHVKQMRVSAGLDV